MKIEGRRKFEMFYTEIAIIFVYVTKTSVTDEKIVILK